MIKLFNNRTILLTFLTSVLVLCIIIFFSNNLQVYAKHVEKLYKVKVNSLRIRDKPSLKSQVVGTISKDIIFEGSHYEDEPNIEDRTDIIDGIEGRWVYIRFFDGYIFTGYLQDVSDEYIKESYENPPFVCELDDSNNLKCENKHENDSKNKNYSLKNVNKILFYQYYCKSENKKDVLAVYDNYKKIKPRSEAASMDWDIFIEKKSLKIVQITYNEGPWGCEE